MRIPDAVEHLDQVEKGLKDIYDHVIKIPLQRIYDIETGQRELEARSMIAGGERASLLEQNDRGARPVVRECTYQDFMKCQPLNFKGTEGVVRELIKLTAEVYCIRNEIQKMESKLWNLSVKNNDLVAYTQRFQELTMMCTKMVPKEEDQVEQFIGGLPNNIQGNVIATEPIRLQDVVRIANNLMDQKLKGYAVKNDKNKRRLEVNQRDNRGKQPLLPYNGSYIGGDVGLHVRPPI
nr:reverse transcriptase domain-containing protein [Tanacetum cinerariifolium]